jgi:hypothetical protein
MEPALSRFKIVADLALYFMKMKESCCSSNLVPIFGFALCHKIKDRNLPTHRNRFKAPSEEPKKD